MYVFFFLNFTLLKGWGDGTTTGILKEMRTKVLSKGECRNTLKDEICTYSPPGHSVAGVSIYEFEKDLRYESIFTGRFWKLSDN